MSCSFESQLLKKKSETMASVRNTAMTNIAAYSCTQELVKYMAIPEVNMVIVYHSRTDVISVLEASIS